MAILFADSGGDHYQTSDIDRIWDASDSVTVVSGGRCSGRCLRVAVHPGGGYFTKGVPATGSTVIVGMAFKGISSTSDMSLFTIMAGSTPMIEFSQQNDGSIKGIYNPDAAFPPTSFLSYGGILPHDVFYYVETKCVLHPSAGTVEFRINGQSLYTATGLTTSVDGTTWTGIKFGSSTFGGTSYFDDIVILDTSGAENNDFIGDVRVEALEPVSDGAIQMWDLGAGSSHWSAVDDGTAPDDDTSFIQSDTLNDTETNVHEDSSLPTSGQVFGVQVNILAKKDQPGDRLVAPITRQAGVNYAGSDLGVNQDSYTFVYDVFQTNPATSAQWTITEVNDSEWGVKVTN